ncbi:bifunctional diaminohydroxyphosphoribosylaminopyrimidine deaminase/5-amino-6-(5-phosphoribosylamino)uracil reductase RibD [Lampropedia puyangensis]|uniref:Riboflavin biosynthesis protein RibD n=2 Tax=Lampropedia puyangensis TaxID=1330072 RepID=A0A4S8ESV1_9BURK|nr:bifunctional diaminohydroxyphosphoribosylaminopyrimidine deaminase/5-amino-6-(5-phosphoribosylamino)uracil reductase RibD [Lampropedia puyangensis]
MQRSLDLAAQAVGITNPNPAVGCVIVCAAGHRVLGEGHTQPVGGPHAEVMALRDAAAKGHDVAGATAYVTLEPCAHYGRTPPCCDALIAAGIGRVVASLQDPNPQVAGQGFARLRAAGIAVDVGDGAAPARQLNLGFLKRMETGMPWVRAKVAASADGGTALLNGQSQWITGPAAREDGQRWRARADVVMTGIGTVLADDPLLNVRVALHGGTTPTAQSQARQPHLAIVDSHLRTPLDAKLWQIAQRTVWIFGLAARDSDDFAWAQQQRQRQSALQAQGAHVVLLPAATRSGQTHAVDLPAVVHTLAGMPVNEIHVEAGARLNGGLLQAGLVDEWLLYLAPSMLGQGKGMAERAAPLTALTDAATYIWGDCQPVGADLRLRMFKTP